MTEKGLLQILRFAQNDKEGQNDREAKNDREGQNDSGGVIPRCGCRSPDGRC